MAQTENTLWVISELYFPEMTSTGYYLTKIAEGLAATRQVKVICGQPNYSAKGTLAPNRENLNGVEIFRTWGARLDKNVILFRFVNMLTLGFSVFWTALFRVKRGDRVLVVTTPPLMPLVAAAAALIKGAAYTLLIHDNYPELAIAVKKVRPDSLLVRCVNRANRWLLKHAAKVIVVGRDMIELVSLKALGLEVPIVCIPNWAELETVEPRPRSDNRLIEELGLQDKFLLLYAGNFGYPNDLESIVDAAESLSGQEKIHFLFVGDGVKLRWFKDQIKKRGLHNLTLLPPMPRDDQLMFLNACDVGIVALVEGMRGVSMPSRTYNLMAAGKPILAICEEGSELDQVVKENGIGWSLPPHQPKDLAARIEEISRAKTEIVGMGQRSRDTAIIQYSLETALRKYSEELGC